MRRPVVPLNAWSRKKIPDPVISVHAVEVDGQRVFTRVYRVTRDRGPRPLGGDGVPVVVLVHGIGVSARYFIPLANSIAEFADVVMIDLPGFSTLPDPQRGLGIEGFARVVLDVIDIAGITDPIILGHSMGAQVVVEAVAQRPDVAGRILLLGPPVNAAERSLVKVGFRFLQSCVLEPIRVGMVAIPAYFMCGMHWFVEVLPAMLKYPIENRIPQISPLTIPMHGEHDFVAPEEWLEELAERVDGPAEIYTVSHAAHSVMYRHHEAVAHRLIRLAATPSPLGGPRVREDDIWACAKRMGADTEGAEDAYQLLEKLLPSPEVVEGESLLYRGHRRIRPRVKGLVEAWHVISGQAMKGVGASFGSGQWRHVSRADYLHYAGQELANIRDTLAEALGIVRSARLEDGDDQPLTPFPLYLIPGMAETWRIWNPLAARLRERGCDVRPIRTLGRSFASIDELARRVEDQLVADDAHDAVLVAHSKGGLVAKKVLLGNQGWRARRIIAAGTPWLGSDLAGLAPVWAAARMLSTSNATLRELAEHEEVNGRIWTVSASFDEQVPNGTKLTGARDIQLHAAGHNQLTDGTEAMAAIIGLVAEDAEDW